MAPKDIGCKGYCHFIDNATKSNGNLNPQYRLRYHGIGKESREIDFYRKYSEQYGGKIIFDTSASVKAQSKVKIEKKPHQSSIFSVADETNVDKERE